jgi:hypothetical protein
MKPTAVKLLFVLALAIGTSGLPVAAPAVDAPAAPKFTAIGPLTFGANDVLFAADAQEATIHAVTLGAAATGGVAGTKDVAGLDQQIAALLGATPRDVTITDLAVHPTTHNTFVSVMRGQGADAKPVLLRVDGAGAIQIVDFAKVTSTHVALPNAPSATPAATRGAPSRAQSITDMAYTDGRLYIAGLSSEEFSSKLRSVPYPFAAVDNGASVEIFHGSHGALETRSPVYAFVPYRIENTPHLISAYLCTPLVKFPVSSLVPGAKVRGTTIAELGAGNRPIDMILYKKDGQEFLLMSNTSRGVMKIPTAGFASATPIVAPVPDKAGVGYETIASMKGIQQLDLLDATHAVVVTRTDAGAMNLGAVALP